MYLLVVCMHISPFCTRKKKLNLSIENDTVLTRKQCGILMFEGSVLQMYWVRKSGQRNKHICFKLDHLSTRSTLEADRIQVTDKLLYVIYVRVYDSTHRDYMATKQSQTIELQLHLANCFTALLHVIVNIFYSNTDDFQSLWNHKSHKISSIPGVVVGKS